MSTTRNSRIAIIAAALPQAPGGTHFLILTLRDAQGKQLWSGPLDIPVH